MVNAFFTRKVAKRKYMIPGWIENKKMSPVTRCPSIQAAIRSYHKRCDRGFIRGDYVERRVAQIPEIDPEGMGENSSGLLAFEIADKGSHKNKHNC
jgi:hypothetical protein